ncbi:uncharacterized protein LOC143208030 [Lasioglossum baleicum]|uniref:uncharacterized protein LOC143208030 n=1 Tax=Lasioglossum baleicum TaxID=434251 RepID=UPI003FCDA6D6
MANNLGHQLQQQHSIERAVANLKKLGKNNWTPTLLQIRIDHLKFQWSRFVAGYTQLLVAITPEERAKLPYFRENHFAATAKAYLDAITFMRTQLNELTSDAVVSETQGAKCQTPSQPRPKVFSLLQLLESCPPRLSE